MNGTESPLREVTCSGPARICRNAWVLMLACYGCHATPAGRDTAGLYGSPEHGGDVSTEFYPAVDREISATVDWEVTYLGRFDERDGGGTQEAPAVPTRCVFYVFRYRMTGLGAWLGPTGWFYEHEWFLVYRVRREGLSVRGRIAEGDDRQREAAADPELRIVDWTRLWLSEFEVPATDGGDLCNRLGITIESGPGRGGSSVTGRCLDWVAEREVGLREFLGVSQLEVTR